MSVDAFRKQNRSPASEHIVMIIDYYEHWVVMKSIEKRKLEMLVNRTETIVTDKGKKKRTYETHADGRVIVAKTSYACQGVKGGKVQSLSICVYYNTRTNDAHQDYCSIGR